MFEKIRRVVTTHNPAGHAVVLSDEAVEPPKLEGFDARSAVLWSTASVPADNVADVKGGSRSQGATLAGGSVLRFTELGPDASSPMHRTYSIDYLMLLSGRLEMTLDGGETLQPEAGDVIVQRGTNHVWRNPSASEPCTFIISMIEALPVVAGGEPLAETHF